MHELRRVVRPGVLGRVCDEASGAIDTEGAFVVNARTGIFVCT